MPPSDSMGMPIFERKWMVNQFIQQKEKEHEAIEKAKSGAKKGSK